MCFISYHYIIRCFLWTLYDVQKKRLKTASDLVLDDACVAELNILKRLLHVNILLI